MNKKMAVEFIRRPAVAGQFYPDKATELQEELARLTDKKSPKKDVIACILPHAGYMYSGVVAGKTISSVKIKDKIVLLGPNHTGFGAAFSVMKQGAWQTPLGNVEVDTDLADRILSHSNRLQEDTIAHRNEHSLEVELPFLQYLKKDFTIVPIVISGAQLAILKEIGRSIAAGIRESDEPGSVLLLASSDMTHYEPQDRARSKDKEAIEAILQLNEDKLMEKVRDLDISMCGFAPVIVMLSAAKSLGATCARLIKYQTSAEVTKDTSSVVGYAGIVVY